MTHPLGNTSEAIQSESSPLSSIDVTPVTCVVFPHVAELVKMVHNARVSRMTFGGGGSFIWERVAYYLEMIVSPQAYTNRYDLAISIAPKPGNSDLFCELEEPLIKQITEFIESLQSDVKWVVQLASHNYCDFQFVLTAS